MSMSMIDTVKRGWAAVTGKAPSALSSTGQVAAGAGLGPWSGIAGWFVPRKINPHLFEAMREAVAPLDGAINRLVTMDGIVAVEGDNDKLVKEITEWMERVQVNDLQYGYQSFVDGIGNEVYEQGCGIGEFVTDNAGRDIVQLRVADSKGIHFRREGARLDAYYQPPAASTFRGDGTDRVEQILRGSNGAMSRAQLVSAGYRPLNLDACVYRSLHPEADNPYGTSIMRSMEFATRILLGIQNATSLTWNRLGDPPLSIVYQTKNKNLKQVDLDARRNTLQENIAKVMRAKRSGNSAEFVNAIGADDAITITVIGAQDKIMEIEMPARHMLEQITSKTGMPGWLLGFQWSAVQGQAEAQGNIVLQESMTRFASSRSALSRPIESMLRLRGRTWKPEDWRLAQRLPNISDELKKAQAEFLRAQTLLMLTGQMPNTQPALGGSGDPAKSLNTALAKMTQRIMGMDVTTRTTLIEDPAAIDALIRESMGW